MSTSMEEVSLIVMIHKTGERVLWVETDKNFVDFLFCLFCIPIGQVLNILNDDKSMGCLRKVYQSVHVMENDFMVCDKDNILKPKVHLSPIPSLLKIENNIAPSPTISNLDSFTTLDLFRCKCTADHLSIYKSSCQCCRGIRDIPVKHYVLNPNPTYVDEGGNGFVKGEGAKYIVTDDLSVMSKSSFSFLEYFTTIDFSDFKGLEEKIVNLNADKCKELLKLALTSNHMVLTNLFKDEVGF